MNEIEFQWLTGPLAGVLTGKGVFGVSLFLAVVFGIIYYFNRSRQLLNSLPGLFTSLGLLGTFVAICNSLGTINEDTLEIDVIIRNLVPAFTSSIAGLISAFIATAGCKIWYSFEDKKLDEKVDKKSPEECLHSLTLLTEQTNGKLSTISQQLIDQAAKNETYNERLNTTISQQSKILEQFINDFVKRMDDIFTKMHGQIEQNIKDFGEEQFKKCADTLEALTQKMSSLSTGLLEEQKTNVQQMIDGTNTELQSVSNTVTEQINALCTQMTSALSTLRTSQDERLTAIVSNYDALSERLSSQNSEFAEKMNAQMKAEYEKIQEQSANSLQQMVDLKDAYSEVNQEVLQSSTAMNREVSAELRNSLSTFVTDLQKAVTDEVNVLSTAIVTNVEALEKSYAYISDHVRNIKGNYESAAQAYIDAVNTAHRMNESQENMLTTINDSMKHVVHTNEKVDEVIAVMEERQERIENLISHINEISTTIEMLQKLESQLNRIANK
ncbi:MotA/TolQ/ExbB proton channel family protein [Bacteroides xylanisolvens]|uniref:MotA/TolQ/ExbB proton channel family protein n=1 Tax=Bacteroides xylanisolvens TaxID=371601 RepID=UPI0039B5E22A